LVYGGQETGRWFLARVRDRLSFYWANILVKTIC
jgi:hypothetical protein